MNFQVVTTFGPKKPQRIPGGSICATDQMDSEHCQLLVDVPATNSPQSLNPQRKLCLETSFTSLQSPSIENQSCSLNSSITNGYYSSKSQTSPIQLTSIITLLDEKLKAKPLDRRNLSLNLPAPKSELSTKKIDLIYDDWFGLAPLASPESLSEVSSISSRTSLAFHLEKCILHDTLSSNYELRTPKVMRRTPKITGNLSTCADDLKSVRYFQKLGQNSKVVIGSSQNENSFTSSGDLSYESATSVSLTRCCSKDHVQFAESKICIPEQEDLIVEVEILEGNSNSNSDSFQSAENILDCETFAAKSVVQKPVYMETHFDEEIFHEITIDNTPKENPFLSSSSSLAKPILKSPTTPLGKYITSLSTSSSRVSGSPQILSPSTPLEIDPDVMANFAMDLNLEEENRAMHFVHPVLIRNDDNPGKENSIDSGSICRTPSESKNVTFNPQVINIDPKFVSRTSPVSSEESPSRISRWLSKKPDKWSLLPGRGKKSAKRSDMHSPLKRRNDDEQCFSKNESLPLLKGLSGANSDKTSPNFVRRKKYVYPITSVAKGESSV